MKSSKNIINHLKNNPTYKKLQQKECEQILLNAMPQSQRALIKFVFVKDDILFIVVHHPSYKHEINNDYRINNIKTILKMIKKVKPQCECIDKEQIKVLVTNKKDKKIKPLHVDSVPIYKERAAGEFENLANDSLHVKLEEIREVIKNDK